MAREKMDVAEACRVLRGLIAATENLIVPAGHGDICLKRHPSPCRGLDFCVMSLAQEKVAQAKEFVREAGEFWW